MTRVTNIENQTIDLPQDNPLKQNSPTLPKPPKAIANQSLKDPKLKLLFILGTIIVLLLFLTLIAAIFKKKPTSTPYQPTTYPTLTPAPSVVQTQLSPEWYEKLNARETETKLTQDFLPSQIDTDIGL